MKFSRPVRLLSLFLMLSMACAVRAQTQANTNGAQPASQLDARSAKIREQVMKMGMGHKITVDLKQGEDLHGAISKIGEQSFEIVEVDRQAHMTVAYEEVRKVRGVYGGQGASGRRPNPRIGLLVFGGLLGFLLTIAILVGKGG